MMKNRIITSSVLIMLMCVSLFLEAGEIEDERDVRGISITPMVPQIVEETIRLDIPFSCIRSNSIHQKEKYPITWFRADCPGKSPCFSLSIIVMLIPESIRTFEEVIRKSELEDFGPKKTELPSEVITTKESNATKTGLIFGNHLISGNQMVGYFYSKENKVTAKVIAGLVFMEAFPEEEWQYILLKTFQIMKSVRFVK